MTRPRTPPSGFRRATSRPSRTAAWMLSGSWARASCCAARKRRRASASESRRLRKCSAVAPDGPAAAPRRAWRRLARNFSSDRISSGGACVRSAGGRGRAGSGGRRAGSRSCAKVAGVPGARGSAVRARAAADSSPRCARAAARSARVWVLGRRGGGRGALWAVVGWASSSSACHCPGWNCAARRSSSSAGMWVVPGARWRSMRGSKKKSFHARTRSSRVEGAARSSKAWR